MQGWEQLILEVNYSSDKEKIYAIFANRKRVLSDITDDKFRAYLEQLQSEGWEIVHVDTMDKVYSIYHFNRKKTKKATADSQ